MSGHTPSVQRTSPFACARARPNGLGPRRSWEAPTNEPGTTGTTFHNVTLSEKKKKKTVLRHFDPPVESGEFTHGV